MNYKTKISPEGSGYIGRIYADGNVVYESSILKDPVLVTRELSEFIASIAENTTQTPRQQSYTQPVTNSPIIPGNSLSNATSNPLVPSTPIISPRQYSPVRRGCCGRG